MQSALPRTMLEIASSKPHAHLNSMIESADAAAMLAPLRPLVREGDFTRLAYRIAAAGVISRSDGRYLAGRAFALITNNYPPFLADKAKLASWVRAISADWSPAIERSAADPDRLPGLVDAMLSELETWPPRSGPETGTPA